MQRAFFGEGLVFSLEKMFFEHQNTFVMQRYSLLSMLWLKLASPTGFEPVLNGVNEGQHVVIRKKDWSEE